jgi:hypothetical protein
VIAAALPDSSLLKTPRTQGKGRLNRSRDDEKRSGGAGLSSSCHWHDEESPAVQTTLRDRFRCALNAKPINAYRRVAHTGNAHE